jgi:hypothetical protein
VTARVPVVAGLAGYREAVAGLPIHAAPAEVIAGSIVVVDGAIRWWDAAARAVDAGALAVLVAEPREVPLDAVRDLAAGAGAGVPILVHRARLRADLVAQAVEHRDGLAPRVIVAECRAPAGRLVPMVRDAIGWMRSLAAVPLVVASASASSDGGTALLRARDDARVVGSLIAAATRPEGEFLRVQALGETTSELELDDPAGRSELATTTRRGRLVAPGRYEAGERVALRRAIGAVAGAEPSDLTDLVHDEEAVAAIDGFRSLPAIFS